MKKLAGFLYIFSIGCLSHDLSFIEKVFIKAHTTKSFNVKDTISKEAINTKMVKVFDKNKKLLGYYREIVTTTGCQSACLPIKATLFYSPSKSFMTVRSKDGLTKKDHVPFTQGDYSELDFILTLAPKEFQKVVHPKDMVDVMTGATKKEFQPVVIKKAAYTSLRLHLYNQETLGYLKK